MIRIRNVKGGKGMVDVDLGLEDDRIKLAIKGLDEQMEGGIPTKSVTLICGASGSMKSTIAFNILINRLREKGTKALYLSLEQDRQSLVDHIRSMGMDMTGLEESLLVTDLGKLRESLADGNIAQIDWFGNIINGIQEHRDRLGIEVVALDSLDALTVLADTPNTRNRLFSFFQSLRTMGLTSFIISEMPSDRIQFGSHGVEAFLADGVIHIDLRREGNNVGLYISIVKMRKTKHARKYFPLLMEDDGTFTIVSKG
jgi:KaiC/GvpD/RAD55 family RecA-like ATPase